MTSVSVIGCGAMGSALARAFLAGGHRTTVWNRTLEKALPLVEAGAYRAESVGGAIQASDVVVVCIADYPATYALFAAPDLATSLEGKTLIQFSTGEPEEAREAHRWAASLGAAYLDGALLAFPKQIGRASTTIFLSGDEGAWKAHLPLIQCLAGKPVFVGADAGGAEAVDLAILTNFLCAAVGAAHSAAICEAEGIDMAHVLSVLPDTSDAAYVLSTIKVGKFANPGATVDTWHNTAVQKLRKQAMRLGIGRQVPEFIYGITTAAQTAGYGPEHIAALTKLMRKA
ncbi:MAG: NAD(P)-binding domain-containing protein [Hyphomicrobiaceae bacterium]